MKLTKEDYERIYTVNKCITFALGLLFKPNDGIVIDIPKEKNIVAGKYILYADETSIRMINCNNKKLKHGQKLKMEL